MEKKAGEDKIEKLLKKVENLDIKIHIMSSDVKGLSGQSAYTSLTLGSLEDSVKVLSSKVEDLDGKFDKMQANFDEILALQKEMSKKFKFIGS